MGILIKKSWAKDGWVSPNFGDLTDLMTLI